MNKMYRDDFGNIVDINGNILQYNTDQMYTDNNHNNGFNSNGNNGRPNNNGFNSNSNNGRPNSGYGVKHTYESNNRGNGYNESVNNNHNNGFNNHGGGPNISRQYNSNQHQYSFNDETPEYKPDNNYGGNIGSGRNLKAPIPDRMGEFVNNNNVESEKPVDIKKLKPIEGSEFKPLVPPHLEVEKEILNDTYFRYVVKERSDMDMIKHGSIYNPESKVVPVKITMNNDKIKICDDVVISTSLSQALDVVNLNLIESDEETVLVDLLITTPYSVKIGEANKLSTAYVDMVNSADNLSALANRLKQIMVVIKSCNVSTVSYDRINTSLTNKINEVLKYHVNFGVKMTSFKDDMYELKEHIDSLPDVKSNIFNNSLTEMLVGLKKDAKLYDEYHSDIEDIINEYIGVKYTATVTLSSITAVSTQDESIKYELKSPEIGDVLKVGLSNTPVLHSVISYLQTINKLGESSAMILHTSDKLFKILWVRTYNEVVITRIK